ncbi:MAG: hypothetical protein ACH0QD_13195 [Tepidibacillus sp.]
MRKWGAGIALAFRKRIPILPSFVTAYQPFVGEAVFYEARDGLKIFNLITKERYWQKPTYESLNITLQDLKLN